MNFKTFWKLSEDPHYNKKSSKKQYKNHQTVNKNPLDIDIASYLIIRASNKKEIKNGIAVNKQSFKEIQYFGKDSPLLRTARADLPCTR